MEGKYCQKFHQYQQNKITSDLKSLNIIKTRTHDIGQAQKCDRVKPVTGISTMYNLIH